MPASVLGKRTRAAAAAEKTAAGTTQTVLTRSKRRIVVDSPNDENRNPFVHHDIENGNKNEPEDETENVEPTHHHDAAPHSPKQTRPTPARTAPAKHGKPEQRIAASTSTSTSTSAPAPADLTSLYPSSKAGSIDVHDDGKAGPHTPRRRDAPGGKKVQIPVTPRHRVLLAGSRLTPRSPHLPHSPHSPHMLHSPSSLRTPRTPGSPANARTAVYQRARQLFSRAAVPGQLVGRESEKGELERFVRGRLEGREGGCLYISGPPGTGKSAFVEDVAGQLMGEEGSVRMAVVNCMSVKSARDLSGKLVEELELGEQGVEDLKACFVRGKKETDARKYLVILDEVDRMVDLDLALLYSLFEWSMQPSSRLVLVGIANALDLTDRFLPRLKSRNLKPELLPFMPYSAAQIADVLTSKLKTLNTPSDEPAAVPFIHPAAIQFCAKKVAAQTGDLRKAFDICRRAIDLVETETREKDAEAALQASPSKTPLMENINLSSPQTTLAPTTGPTTSTTITKTYTPTTAPRATITHLATITAHAFSNGTTQRLAALNLQQKAVLCALSTLETHNRNNHHTPSAAPITPSKHSNAAAAPTIKALYTSYATLCARDRLLHPLTHLEFRDVVAGLETLSLVTMLDQAVMTPSRTPRGKGKGGFGTLGGAAEERRVAGVVGRGELERAVEGRGEGVLREMLEGVL